MESLSIAEADVYTAASLFKKIEECLEGKDADNSGGFLPEPVLKALVKKKTVKTVLQSLGENELQQPEEETSREAFIDKLASFVTDEVDGVGAHKIFATLIRMGKPGLIQSFYASDIRQDFLPAFYDSKREAIISGRRAEEDGDSQEPSEQGLREVLRQAAPDGKQIRGWTPADMAHFCGDQWKFLSPIFDGHVFSHEFPTNMPLPYANCLMQSPHGSPQQVPADEEARHVVHRCIHSGHLKLSPGETISQDDKKNFRVAVKQLPGKATKMEVEQEIKTLRKIRDSFSSKHIIRAIAHFELKGQQPVHSILFPWADKGNLRHFWADNSRGIARTNTDPKFVEWVVGQLSGLAEAVAEMHEPQHNIRHGDIKPDNILCFFDESLAGRGSDVPVRLVLTDVGTSKDHLKSTESRYRRDEVTKVKVWTTRYAAPELSEVSSNNLSVLSRKFDVWSLGCVYAEFLIWLLYGHDNLQRFYGEAKQFYEGKGKVTIVSRAANRWLMHILGNEDGRCSAQTAVGCLARLIKDKLLVVLVNEVHHRHQQPPTPESPPTPGMVGCSFVKMAQTLMGCGRTNRPASPVDQRGHVEAASSPEPRYRASAAEAKAELAGIIQRMGSGELIPIGEGRGRSPPPCPKPHVSRR